MAYIIAEPCIDVKDGSCVEVCPVDCIHTTDSDNMYYIHPDECIDCAACEPVCPVTAIFEASQLPKEWAKFIDLNKEWFVKKA
jgi:NAD-dependent dihydropyrimidine dehydrogenase PreA subunit